MKKYLILPLILISVLAVCDVNNQCEADISSNLTLFVRNRTDQSPLTGADCFIDIWNPNRTKITDDGSLVEETEGKYYYTLSGGEVTIQGVHEILYRCNKSSYTSYEPSEYEIVTATSHEYYSYWNNTLFTDWDSKINATWYNIVTPASQLMQNILDYLDGQLTTVLNDTDKEDIAQKTWNDTIVPDRKAEEDPGPQWRGWGQGWG